MVADLEPRENLSPLIEALQPFQSSALALKLQAQMEAIPTEQRKERIQAMIALYNPPVESQTGNGSSQPYVSPANVDILASLYLANQMLHIAPDIQIATATASAARKAATDQQRILAGKTTMQGGGFALYQGLSEPEYASTVRLPQLLNLGAFAPVERQPQAIRPPQTGRRVTRA